MPGEVDYGTFDDYFWLVRVMSGSGSQIEYYELKVRNFWGKTLNEFFPVFFLSTPRIKQKRRHGVVNL